MDWLEDFFSKIVGWLDQISAGVHNAIIGWINDSLIATWNGWMDSLLHPAQAMPSIPALRWVVDWLFQCSSASRKFLNWLSASDGA